MGIGGNVRHTKAVFWLSEELLSHRLYAPFSDTIKNDIRVACLLHDGVKLGEGDGTGHTAPNHPLLVRKVLRPWNNDEVVSAEMFDAWNRICSLIETHMDIWTKDKEGNEILEEPTTQAQLFVHMVDYLASRRIVEIDTTQRVSSTSKPTRREDMATDGQVDLLKSLAHQCCIKGIVVAPISLTDNNGVRTLKKGLASDLIQDLKAKLAGD